MAETMRISPGNVVVQHQGLLSNALSNSEMVLLDIEKGSYFGMESVAKRIWDNLAEPISVGALCDRLLASYAVDRDTCLTEVMDFLEELNRHGLIEVSEAALSE